MKCLIVGMLVVLSACAGSKYAVVPQQESQKEVSVNGKILVSIGKNDVWQWHKKPEEVVVDIIGVANKSAQELAAAKARIAELETKLAAVTPVQVDASTTTAKK